MKSVIRYRLVDGRVLNRRLNVSEKVANDLVITETCKDSIIQAYQKGYEDDLIDFMMGSVSSYVVLEEKEYKYQGDVKMSRAPYYKFSNKESNVLETVSVIKVGFHGKVASVGLWNDSVIANPLEEGHELLQYTGLRDEDGVAVFEGHRAEYNGKMYDVVFELGAFMLMRVDDKTDMYKEFVNAWNSGVYFLAQLYLDTGSEKGCINGLRVLGLTKEFGGKK